MSNLRETVFVVDDDEAVRDSLTLLLEAEGLVTEGFDNAQAFLEAYRPERSGCLVLDVRMPGMNGLELQRRLNQTGASLPVIFITGHGDVPMSVKALKGGALDFLEKPFDGEELVALIHKAFLQDARRRREQAAQRQVAERFARLTPREQEVMRLVTQGKSNKEIAAALGVSHRTVEIHRARVMEKMAANSLPDLVAMATAVGLSTPALP
jgi:RNA polymerase sigma factor (sigma-70 family)